MKKVTPKITKKNVNDASKKNNFTVLRFLLKNIKIVVVAALSIVVIVFAVVLFRSSQSVIQNLVNTNYEVLNSSLFGEKAYISYCISGSGSSNSGLSSIPKIFSDLNAIKGNSLGFAAVNCSQILPSGKTLMTRLKLKKEIRPTIFGTAPWMKPTQANPKYLKDVKSLQSFVDIVMQPKGTSISSDKSLRKFCGLNKKIILSEDVVGDTCFVILRGTRYSKAQTDLEEKLIKQNPKLKFAAVDATKYRLSFEDIEELPADVIFMKVHALRNGTHYMSMVNPMTWDYLNNFVAQASGSLLYDYNHDNKSKIKLLSVAAIAKKVKNPPQEDSNKGSKTKPSSSKPTKKEEDPVEQLRRERERREEMERQEKAQLFEENDDEDDKESDSDDDHDDENSDNVIEL